MTSKKPAPPAAPNLTWPEIRAKAAAFARDWAQVGSERAEAQTFWNEFFAVFGVQRRRVAVYEQRAQRLGKAVHGRIDVFWPGTLLAEHKSAGQDLDAAFVQATNYFAGLTEPELPRYVVVSDFQHFRLHDLDEGTISEFTLAELPKRIQDFGFIAGYARVRLREEPEANIRAVQKLGELHDALKRNRYGLAPDGRAGHPLQVFLVRLLFCLFADDTGLFSPKDAFRELIDVTRPDGSDTGAELARLFQVLNTPLHARQAAHVDKFAPFPYVNGKLFEESLPIPEFDADMRVQLLACCDVQWAEISPAIFGAMFQKVIDLDAKDRRRQLGAHYTSEANILKLIGPLFLDELRAEFERVRHHKEQLFAFHKSLTTLHFLDPACGCGNFLVITYRELRRLELDVLQAARVFGEPDLDQVFGLFKISLAQFHGIEIEEFPAQVAQVAMWLTQHQMDLVAGEAFGTYFRHLPLHDSAHIRHGNALRLDWEDFVPPERLDYILGNPPFVGKQHQTDEQKRDLEFVAGKVKGAGVLDFVTGWYFKAAQYLSGTKEGFASPDKREFADVEFSGKAVRAQKKKAEACIEDIFVAAERADATARGKIRCAFVSTNSISQGEQVGVLWSELLKRGMHIQFAHRTFKWSNEAPGKAAVHCVIVGFGREDIVHKRLFDYPDIDGPAHEMAATNINPYLVDAPDAALPNRREPLCAVPPMVFGSMPNDGGHLLLTDDERAALLVEEPQAEPWIRPFLGAEEFINGIPRWCLWLKDIAPAQLKALPQVLTRVEAVRAKRAASGRAATNKLAATPTLFGEIRQPTDRYILVPRHSSENRAFIPLGYVDPKIVVGDSNMCVPDAPLWLFAIMTSTMHMAWVRAVCGRLKSDFRYSAQIVYNNFPWPSLPPPQPSPASGGGSTACAAIEAAAQTVLDARAAHPDSTLADLYGPDTMPPDLVKAHAALDRAVNAAYRKDGGARSYASDAERVAFLFRRYAALTSVQ
ncbi:MAG: N-6 DNA methylase [Pseudomonadota bacterium]|nr:N-6 DNA methylase [Pseudomonadota bacterium]